MDLSLEDIPYYKQYAVMIPKDYIRGVYSKLLITTVTSTTNKQTTLRYVQYIVMHKLQYTIPNIGVRLHNTAIGKKSQNLLYVFLIVIGCFCKFLTYTYAYVVNNCK
jgi:hypothetical protein